MATKLIFTDLSSGEQWEHDSTDRILLYCNFNSNIHPCLLKHGQIIFVTDKQGNKIKIEAERIKNNDQRL